MEGPNSQTRSDNNRHPTSDSLAQVAIKLSSEFDWRNASSTDAEVTATSRMTYYATSPVAPSIAPSTAEDSQLNFGNEGDSVAKIDALLEEEETNPLLNTTEWQKRFNHIINEIRSFNVNSNLEHKVAVNVDLVGLTNDFIHTVTLYGKIIISEMNLPISEKTLKPDSALGGVCGGQKFIVRNVLFKVATDHMGLFGGDDGAASKVAGHELKGMKSYYNCGVSQFSLPLIALLDYRGYRIVALSLLPISKSTLIYGTDNGGQRLLSDHKEFNELLAKTCVKLNLKAHHSGLSLSSTKTLFSCSDLEGHLGSDGKFYLLDFSRTFPPEKPNRSHGPNTHLYELLRPEFVATYREPLNPDAYSKFGNNPSDNSAIDEATNFLFREHIPAVAAELGDELSRAHIKGQAAKFPLISYIHRKGVNCRHLGRLRSCLETGQRPLLLLEMIARTVRSDLRERMRLKMRSLRFAPLEDPFRRLVLAYLNLLFSNRPSSETYWGHLKNKLCAKFESALTAAEESISLKKLASTRLFGGGTSYLDGRAFILLRLQKLGAIKLVESVVQYLLSGGAAVFERSTLLDETNIEALGTHVKHFNRVLHAQGYIFKFKGICRARDNPEEARRFFEMAIEKFEEGLSGDPNNIHTLRNYAQSLSLLGALSNSTELTARALEVYRQALQVQQRDTHTLYQMGRLCEYLGDDAEAERLYLLAVEADREHSYAVRDYIWLLRRTNRDTAIKDFSAKYSIDITEYLIAPVQQQQQQEAQQQTTSSAESSSVFVSSPQHQHQLMYAAAPTSPLTTAQDGSEDSPLKTPSLRVTTDDDSSDTSMTSSGSQIQFRSSFVVNTTSRSSLPNTQLGTAPHQANSSSPVTNNVSPRAVSPVGVITDSGRLLWFHHAPSSSTVVAALTGESSPSPSPSNALHANNASSTSPLHRTSSASGLSPSSLHNDSPSSRLQTSADADFNDGS